MHDINVMENDGSHAMVEGLLPKNQRGRGHPFEAREKTYGKLAPYHISAQVDAEDGDSPKGQRHVSQDEHQER